MRYSASPDGKTIKLIGGISEESDFTELLGKVSDECSIDLAEVKRINSTGVRKWLSFITAVPADKHVKLARCPVLFVSQMNMIANFAGSARVESVYVPLICSSCEASTEEVVSLTVADPRAFSPSSRCAECGGALTLDAELDDFFAFLSSS